MWDLKLPPYLSNVYLINYETEETRYNRSCLTRTSKISNEDTTSLASTVIHRVPTTVIMYVFILKKLFAFNGHRRRSIWDKNNASECLKGMKKSLRDESMIATISNKLLIRSRLTVIFPLHLIIEANWFTNYFFPSDTFIMVFDRGLQTCSVANIH